MMIMPYRQINTDWLAQNLPGDVEFLRDIFSLFEDQGKELQQQIQKALRNITIDGLHASIHKMRGSASAVGLEALTQRLAKLDDSMKAGAIIDDLREPLTQVTQDINAALAELNRYIEEQN